MAQSSSIVPKKLLCRFFAVSACRLGEYCQFSHDKNITTVDNVCRYYIEGRCYFGPRCRFDHVKMNPNREEYKKIVTRKLLPENKLHSEMPTFNQQNTAINNSNLTNLSYSDKKCINPVSAFKFTPKSKQMTNIEKNSIDQLPSNDSKHKITLCTFCESGDCSLGEACDKIHGEICEICGLACLIPFDSDQQKQHKDQCKKENFTENTEHLLIVQKSKDKICAICYDTIMKKEKIGERRFGIMSSCNHIFCLSCIRQWRQTKQINFKNKAIVNRACPECRLHSNFIIPNSYWIDNEEEKKKFVEAYKMNLSKKHCKYFLKGEGNCPFKEQCFYIH